MKLIISLKSQILVVLITSLLLCSRSLFAIDFSYVNEANDVLEIENLEQPLSLSEHLEILDDPDHTITFESIASGVHDAAFYHHTQSIFNGPSWNTRYWFRVRLKPSAMLSDDNAVLYFYMLPSRLYKLGVYIVTSDKTRSYETGVLFPYANRDRQDLHYAFDISLNPNHVTTLIGYADNSLAPYPATIPLKLMSAASYQQTSLATSMILVSFYSVLTALLLYNGFLFLSLRQPLYGYYVAFLISATYLCTEVDGVIFKILDFHRPLLHNVTATAVGMAFLAFVYHALAKTPFLPAYQRIFPYIQGLGWAMVLGGFLIPYDITGVIAQLYATLAITVNFIVITTAVVKRAPSSVLLLLAESFTLFGGSICLLTFQGVLEFNSFTLWSLHWGFLGEAIFLSFAVASRTRYAQEESIQYFKKYKEIYQNSNEALFQFNLKQQHLTCNPAFAHLFGYDDPEALYTSLTGEESHSPQTRFFQELLEKSDGNLSGHECTITSRKNQQEFWVSLSLNLRNDVNGNPESVEGSMLNITERKLKEAAQQQALDNIKKADKVKDEFLATISHELITPINGVVGNLELLHTKEFDEEVTQYIANLGRSTSELTMLVNRILNFTQIQAGIINLEEKSFLLADLLQPLINQYQELCRQKSLTFEYEIDQSSLQAYLGDERKIIDILDGLLGNAIKFTEKGSICFAVKSAISANDKSLMSLRFSIRDTGKGISEEDRAKIFAAFTQADGSFSRKYGGLGLGLAMCKCFSDLMSGDLTVRSLQDIAHQDIAHLEEAHNGGTQFDFIVTLKIDLNREIGNPIFKSTENFYSHTKVASRAAKILIVEDNKTNQLVLKGILNKLGHYILSADNGAQALDILKTETIDLIFMDCQMPVMDGFEATKAIRTHYSFARNIPIIAVTANIMAGDREKCLKAGMDDYMKKPITKKQIEAKLQQWLSFLSNSANG